jgi:hypothetical protein
MKELVASKLFYQKRTSSFLLDVHVYVYVHVYVNKKLQMEWTSN